MKTWLVVWFIGHGGHPVMLQQAAPTETACQRMAPVSQPGVVHTCGTAEQAAHSILEDGCTLVRVAPNGLETYICERAP